MVFKCILIVRCGKEVMQRSFQLTTPPRTCAQLRAVLQAQDMRLQGRSFDVFASCSFVNHNTAVQLTTDATVKTFFDGAEETVTLDVTISAEAAIPQFDASSFLDDELVTLLIYPPLRDGLTTETDITEKTFVIPITGVHAALCRAVRDTIQRDDVSLCRVELFRVNSADGTTTPIVRDLDATQMLNHHAKERSPCRLTYLLHPPVGEREGGRGQASKAYRRVSPKAAPGQNAPQNSTVAEVASHPRSTTGVASPLCAPRVNTTPSATSEQATQGTVAPPLRSVTPSSMQLTISQPVLDEESSPPHNKSPTTPPTTRSVRTTQIQVLSDTASDVHEITFVYAKHEPAVLARLGRECAFLTEAAQVSAGGQRPSGVVGTTAAGRSSNEMALAVVSGGEHHDLRSDADLWEWLALSAESGRPLRVRLSPQLPVTASPAYGMQVRPSSPTQPPTSAILPISVTCIRVSTPARSPPRSPSGAGTRGEKAVPAAAPTLTPPANVDVAANKTVLPELKRRTSRSMDEDVTATVDRAHARRLPEVPREGGVGTEGATAAPRPSSPAKATPSSLTRPPPRLPVVRANPPAVTPDTGGGMGSQSGAPVTRLPVVRSPRESASGGISAPDAPLHNESLTAQTPPLTLGAATTLHAPQQNEQQRQSAVAEEAARACSAMWGNRAAAVLPLSSAALAAAAGATAGGTSRHDDSASCPAVLSVSLHANAAAGRDSSRASQQTRPEGAATPSPTTLGVAAAVAEARAQRGTDGRDGATAPSAPLPLSAVEVQPPRERRPSSRLTGAPRSRGGSQATATPTPRRVGAHADGLAEGLIALSATEVSPTRRRKSTTPPSRVHDVAHGAAPSESRARASESASETGSMSLPPVLTQTCAAVADVMALITDDDGRDTGGEGDGWPVQIYVRWGTCESLAAGYTRRSCILQDLRRMVCDEFSVVNTTQGGPHLFVHEMGDEAYSRTELVADEQLLSALRSLSLSNCSMIEVKSSGRAPLSSSTQPGGMHIALGELVKQLTCQLVAVAHETKLQDLLMACEPYTRHITDAARFFQRLTAMPEAKMAAQHPGVVDLVLQRCLRDVHDAAGESLVQVCNACVRFANTDRPAGARRYFYARLYYALQEHLATAECARVGDEGKKGGSLTQATARQILHPVTVSFNIASQAETLTLDDWVAALAGVHATELGSLLDAIALARARAVLPVRNFRVAAAEEESVLRHRLLEEVRHCFDGCTLASLESFVQHPAPDLDLPEIGVLLSVVGCLLAPRPTRQYARWIHDHFYGDEATTLFATMRNFQSSRALPLPSLYTACWEMLKPDLDYCLLAQKSDEAGRLARWAFFAVQVECLERHVAFPPVPPLHGVPTRSSAVGIGVRLPPTRRQESIAGDPTHRDGTVGRQEDLSHGHGKHKTKVHYKYVYHCGDLRTPRVFVPATNSHASKLPLTPSSK